MTGRARLAQGRGGRSSAAGHSGKGAIPRGHRTRRRVRKAEASAGLGQVAPNDRAARATIDPGAPPTVPASLQPLARERGRPERGGRLRLHPASPGAGPRAGCVHGKPGSAGDRPVRSHAEQHRADAGGHPPPRPGRSHQDGTPRRRALPADDAGRGPADAGLPDPARAHATDGPERHAGRASCPPLGPAARLLPQAPGRGARQPAHHRRSERVGRPGRHRPPDPPVHGAGRPHARGDVPHRRALHARHPHDGIGPPAGDARPQGPRLPPLPARGRPPG